METEVHILWPTFFSNNKKASFEHLHYVFLTGNRRASSHLWWKEKQTDQQVPHSQQVFLKFKMKKRKTEVGFCDRPCGLHLPSGLWVFEHLDNRLRLWLELLQLGHHSTPLLPQGWNRRCTFHLNHLRCISSNSDINRYFMFWSGALGPGPHATLLLQHYSFRKPNKPSKKQESRDNMCCPLIPSTPTNNHMFFYQLFP